VILLIHLKRLHNGVVEHSPFLLQDLLGSSDLLLGTLDRDVDHAALWDVPAIGDINPGTSGLAQLVHT
jgi:hypothetical protein